MTGGVAGAGLLELDGLHPPAAPSDLAALEALAGPLPGDLRAFLLWSDGYDGRVGEGGYAQLWPARAILAHVDGYEAANAVPGHLLIGSNAGPTAYGVEARAGGLRFVSVPFVPMAPEEVRVLGATLAGFLAALARGEGW